jgi:hypothetical protein
MLRLMLAATANLVAFGLIGCSGVRTAPEMVEVTGQVKLNGRPVEKMIMNLTPLTPGQGREDDTVVEHGTYRVKLIAAQYKVAFTAIPGGPGVPVKYQTADKSNLVLDGTKPDTINFDLN